MKPLDEVLKFNKHSKKEWLDKVSAELKAKDINDLSWTIGEREFSPFYSAEDVSTLYDPSSSKKTNDWGIGEYVLANNEKDANDMILKALSCGAEELWIDMTGWKDVTDPKTLLDKVHLDFIRIKFECREGHDVLFAESLTKYVKQASIDVDLLRGTIFSGGGGNFGESNSINSYFPVFDTRHFSFINLYQGVDNVVKEVKGIYDRIGRYLDTFQAQPSIHQPVKVSLTLVLGDHLFVNIAKLRAVRILTQHLFENHNLNGGILKIETVPDHKSDMDINEVYIKSPLIALSAAIGGADSVYMNYGLRCSEDQQRILLNNSHILKMESYLDQVVDPAGGSYFIESLTHWLVSSVDKTKPSG